MEQSIEINENQNVYYIYIYYANIYTINSQNMI